MKFIYIFCIFLGISNCQAAGTRDYHDQDHDERYQKELLKRWFELIKAGRRLDEIRKLSSIVDVNAYESDEYGLCRWTALRHAVMFKHIAIVQHLLTLPNLKIENEEKYWYPLVNIVDDGNEKMFTIFLQSGRMNVNAPNNKGKTAFFAAAHRGYENMAKMLLAQSGIEINLKDSEGRTAFSHAVEFGRTNIIKLLLQEPRLDLNIQDEHGWTALMYAVKNGNVDNLNLLLGDSRIDVNITSNKCESALMLAAYWGRSEIISILLRVPGIYINASNRKGTALDIARKKEFTQAAERIDTKLKELEAQVIQAIKDNDCVMFRKISAQIGVDNLMGDGNTLLHIACIYNRPEIAITIFQEAYDPRELLNMPNKNGELALELIAPSSILFEYLVSLAYGQYHGDFQCACCLKSGCGYICSYCKVVYYCSRECQKAGWKIHKTHCASPA